MTKNSFLNPHPWLLYSKKLQAKIERLTYAGSFTQEEAAARAMRLVVGEEGQIRDGHAVRLFWLIDESDGVIVDARFEAFGPTALLGAADAASEILMRLNYDQARRISAELIDQHLRDKNAQVAFPSDVSLYLNLVLFAIEDAAAKCSDIPFADTYVSSPVAAIEGTGEYPGWLELTTQQKIMVIEEVIQRDIRPYIELDAGGVRVINLLDNREVVIAYEGSCTSCYSATGSTLNAIQQILRAKVYPDLIVTPDASFLK